jgi:hypothetical protein
MGSRQNGVINYFSFFILMGEDNVSDYKFRRYNEPGFGTVMSDKSKR